MKTIGKWVSENGDVATPALPFTVFETYRQQVGKNEWVPRVFRAPTISSEEV